MTRYIHIIFRLTTIVLTMAGLGGCLNDNIQPPSGDGQPVRVQLYISGSAATRAGDFRDDLIGTIDVLSFNEGTGKFQYRATAYAIDGDNKWFDIVLHKSRDEYQRLVVLANLGAELDQLTLTPGVTSRQDLQESLKFNFLHRKEHGGTIDGSQELGDGRLLPMWGESEPVAIVRDVMTLGTIHMLRSMATVSVEINLPAGHKKFELVDVVVYNTPAHGHAIAAAGNVAPENPMTESSAAVAPSEVAGTTYGKAYYVCGDGKKIIRKIFIGEKDNDTDGTRGMADKDKSCLVIGGKYDNDTDVTWYRIPFTDKDGKKWDILRNHDYIFNITNITGRGSETEEGVELEVELSVKPWEAQGMNPLGDVQLSVSAVSASINDRNMARIHFWSNQKREDISIVPRTAADDVFNGLTGENTYNLHYDEATGAGWIDIMTDRSEGAFTRTYYINISAAGLKREIAVDVTIPGGDLSLYENYVGAFWRNGQTGERVISRFNVSRRLWTATASESWILLEYGKSLDPNLWSGNEPGDPENYQLENGTNSISGLDNIYFRIGLAGENTGGAPRYGKVTITVSGGNTYDIYVRQGEDADYLMRNGSLDGSITRTRAVRYSPYNLTSLEFIERTKKGGTTRDGHSQIGGSGDTSDAARTNAVFTEYPTQAGAYFQWANTTNIRYAWHPSNPNGDTRITDWDESVPDHHDNYWNGPNELRLAHETCPVGYRRPDDGSTTAGVGSPAVADSEQRQSLWLNPPVHSDQNNDNVVWGYYADGFFDRRKIVSAVSDVPGVRSAVCTDIDDYRVAYQGSLFYNPNNNASLFFPASGYRISTRGGYLNTSGTNGNYWTATGSSNTGGWHLSFRRTYTGQDPTSRSSCFTIRCVAE